MDPHLVRVLLPHREVLFDIDPLDAVQRHDVKIPHGLIVLGRVSCCDDDKTVRNLVIAEHLVLQKLQHGGRQRLRDAVDLVKEKDAFRNTGQLDLVVDRGHDLTHCVLGYRVLLSAVFLFGYKGEADGALPCVMGDRIGDQADPALLRHLLHNGSLADAGRSHEKDRPLPLRRDLIGACLVLLQIGPDCIDHFLLSFLDV